MLNEEEVLSFPIHLGFNPIGHKEVEGDGKTPEGLYFIDAKNDKSKFYLNLGISYPNDRDINFAQSINKSPGGLIKIHGEPNEPSTIDGYPKIDWTQGCIALSNNNMKNLYDLIPVGTPVLIVE